MLVFIDADVLADTLQRIRTSFKDDPALDALFGSYDAAPAAPGLVSQYKNLRQHYVHQHGQTESQTFWSGCGAVRSSVFRALGGFDERYTRPSIQDIDLGYRLKAAGCRIALEPGIQVRHLKKWRLGERFFQSLEALAKTIEAEVDAACPSIWRRTATRGRNGSASAN